MKNSTFSTKFLIAVLLLFMGWETYAQNYIPFVPRYDQAIKGDMLLIGNNSLSVHKTNAYNGSTNNENSANRDKMVYVDIDNDTSTFNSSSANLDVPSDTGCYKVVYAALYWSAVVKGKQPMENIKFKTPGSNSYIDITGTQIYYQNSSNNQNSNAYVFYKDVTDIIEGLSNAEGTYTVGNISSMTSADMGRNRNSEGLSAGWSMFVIYEDPLLPSKYITSFDGYTKIDNKGSNTEQTFLIDGFKTIPVGPVRAKYAFSALEGDKSWTGDYLEINGTRIGATRADGPVRDRIIRPTDNFFNSSVSIIDPNTNAPTPFIDRNPASSNTLGFDAGIINIPNAGNSIIKNNDTSANIKLGTKTDIYYFYFSAFAIEIIAPKIVLTKIVEDAAGNNIGGQEVGLGTELNYVLGFQNTGNDDATNLIIRDILPQNIEFNYPEDIGILPDGVSVQSYNAATREIIFKVENRIVEIGDPVKEIRFKVTVVRECSKLNDACSNIISNQAFSTYNGTDNPNFVISDDPSFKENTGCLLTPGATNFLADITCEFKEDVILCDPNGVELTAGSGYDSYRWTDSTGAVIGNTPSITVKKAGIYKVRNTATAPCQSIDQTFNVVTYGENSANPVLPFADKIVECPNDGKKLPYIFLCGATDVREIRTNLTDTSSIIWEKLNEGSCDAVSNDNCANENSSCTWSEVGRGANYSAKESGQYRVTLNYEGGCFSQYYFNVYSNNLTPTVTSKDIICGIPGEIVVGGVPNGYLYSIDGVNYQPSNVFSIATGGKYNVTVRQVDVDSNPCIFPVPEVQIRERNFSGTTTVIQPLCHGEKGSVKLAANDASPQYFYKLLQGTTEINSVGPIMESDFTFANLNPGTYTAIISTEDGCSETVTFEIINPELLTATSAITKPLVACELGGADDDTDGGIEGDGDGEETEVEIVGGIITVYPKGGTAPYEYFVNGATESQSTPEIVVTEPGIYTIRVVDANNCETETTVKIEMAPAPQFDVTFSDIMCYNSNTGEIRFNVTNANGYTIAYSIDGGNSYTTNPVFSDLGVGTYNGLIKYSINSAECFSEPKTISITQADDALTASAGVSELAGCGPSGEGKVRITNPQGGTPPYQYSFDNQANWTTNNEAFVAPGTYTLYIKDANGCIYPMPGIILEQEPVPPTIAVSEPDFNCDGTASAVVTVNNPETLTYSYTYLLNGVPNTNTDDPKTFLNVPDGTHTISVQYHLESVPTYSNLLFETFGYGDDTTSPGINTQYYCFERQVVETQCNGAPNINDGDYSVTSRVMHPFGTWLQPGDHTPNPNNIPKGRALVVNVGDKIPVTARLYEKEINDIIPGQPITVDFYAINLIMSQHNIYDPNLLVALVDASGNEISSFTTGIIPKSEKWENYKTTLNPGNNTSLKFILRSNVQQVNGNDVAIDDIRVYQLPKTCITQVDFPFVVETGKAFKAQILNFTNATCFGADDGAITIAVQNFDPAKGFQYSLDGVNWGTSMISPLAIPDLAAGDHTIQLRYEDAADTCDLTLNQALTQPSLLEVTATKTDATCLIGGTIKAKATGGTPAYTYELWDAANTTLVKPFPSNGKLNDIPAGDYTVRATDVNGCEATTIVELKEIAAPTATIATTSDFCYDATNGATIKVTASQGKAPYEYKINGGSFQKNDTFSNLIPGKYIIVVRDANGCEVTLPEEIIEPQLKVSTVLTKDLDCTGSPDALITGTITGGYAPYTYEVSINGGAYTSLGATGTPFSYTAATAGTYQFQITDAKGCTATSGISTVDPISPPAFTATPTPILCFGDDNGSIKVEIDKTVGTPPFTINVNNDTTGVNYGTQTSGLPAGTYTVTVTDAKSCFVTKQVEIIQPNEIIVTSHAEPITCDALNGGISKGSVIIDGVTGGTAPYNYFVTGTNYNESELNNSGTISTTFDVVDFGLYQINVVDANGCSVLIQDVLVASPPDDLDIVITPTADCINGGEAIVSIGTTLAGSGPFFFSIYEGPSTVYPTGNWLPEDNPGSKSAKFTGLTPGVLYTFIVYDDSTGCSYFEKAPGAIPTNSNLTATALTVNNITCTGSDDGNVSFTIESPYGVGIDVEYQIFNSMSLITAGVAGTGAILANSTLEVSNLGPLPFGNYYVLITEISGPNAGCSIVTVPFNITESAIQLSLSTSIDQNANCAANSGVISAIGQNGTAPYTYQLTDSAAAPSAADTGWASTNRFNRDAGDYYVHVKDAYGCIVSSPVVVLPLDPTPIVIAVVSNQCDTEEGKFSIDVSLPTEGIAPYSFSINGGAFQTRTAPFTINDLESGTHTIEVKDVNGCGSIATVVIDEPLAITPAVTGIVSCSDDDGQITVTAVGGKGTYTYSINSSAPSIIQNDNVFSGVPSGRYIVTVTDGEGCTATAEITLEVPTPVDFTLIPSDVTCHGGTDGTITVNLPDSNDNPVYSYEITGPIVFGPQSSNVFTGLAAGTYTVQVTSGRACIATDTVTIGEPDEIQITAHTIVEYLCTTGTNSTTYASISVDTVTGGSGTYTKYEFIKGGVTVQTGESPVYTETDLTGGTYTINVYDDNGCVGTIDAEIKPFISLDALTVRVDTDITCSNNEDITVLVTTSPLGATVNLQFVLEDHAGVLATQTNTTGVFTGLPIGNYIITVTNLDTGCSLQTAHYVNDPNTFDLLVDTVVDVTCFDTLDGSVNVTFIDRLPTPTDEAGPFSYTVTDVLGATVASGTTTNAGPVKISNLASGTYTISASLTNTPFCTVEKHFTITAPTAALAITTTHTEITCFDNYNDGSILASATGGWPGGYEYQLSLAGVVIEPFSSNRLFTNLTAGEYTVTVRDSRGCEVPEDVELKNPKPIVFTAAADITLLTCFGDSNATITATLPTGGQGFNYSYTLNTILPTPSSSGPQTSNVFSGLGAGTYSITVTDGYNCSATSADIIITQPDLVEANLVAATTATCDVQATLTLSATGGTGPYTYSTSSTFTSIAGAFVNSTTFNVAPGTYKYYVRDSNGCLAVVTNDIKIEPVPDLEIVLTVTNLDINCFGDDNGAIVAKAQGGLGNYVYTLLGASQTPIAGVVPNTTGIFNGLLAGVYYVKVVSDDCIETSEKIEITQPLVPLEVTYDASNVSCFGGNDGRIEINATSGGRIIKYAISPQLNQFFESNVFENLAPGDYEIIVQDEMGCFEILKVKITEPQPLMVSIVPSSILPEICAGDIDGAFSIAISGGTGPYEVSLDDYDGPYTTGAVGQTQFDFSGLKGGDHTVFVRDSNGCESEWNITFPESVKIEPVAIVEYLCDDNIPGNRVIVNVDESITDTSELDYSLNGGTYQSSNVFNNVLPGIGHYIDVRHTNGCIQRTELFDIVQVAPLELGIIDGGLNEIVAKATGGTGDYQFTLNGENYGSTSSFIIRQSGTYTVTVTDSSGCVATATRYFEFIDICIPNYFTPNGDNNQDTWAPGCAVNYPNLEFKIFDRYGREVGTYRQGQSWDGKYRERELPTGDYWYIVKLNDGKDDRDFVGHFTLYR